MSKIYYNENFLGYFNFELFTYIGISRHVSGILTDIDNNDVVRWKQKLKYFEVLGKLYVKNLL